eukprot:UN01279
MRMISVCRYKTWIYTIIPTFTKIIHVVFLYTM